MHHFIASICPFWYPSGNANSEKREIMNNAALDTYLAKPVGQQLLVHYARRDAVRHAGPLLPFSLSFLRRGFGFTRTMDGKAA